MSTGEPVVDTHDVAEREARDRLVHGLLHTAHERPIDRERRVARAMTSVRRHATAAGFGARFARHAGGLAAVAAVMAAAFLFTPSQVSAADRARATAQGERAVRDRRVMFLLNPPEMDRDRPTLTGTLDVRDDRHMVLVIREPGGRETVHGLDGERAWRMDASGAVHEEPADHPWPVWIRSPRGGLIVDIAESIETGLSTGWTWNVSKGDAGVDQLVAVLQAGPRAEPSRLVASIDATSGRVRKLEIEWPKGGTPAPFDVPPAPRGERAEGDGPMQEPPHGKRPPPPEMRGGEPRPQPQGDAPEGPRGRMRPPPPEPGMQARPDSFDGFRGKPPRARASGPLGAPGTLVIMPEPAVTFPEGWFAPEAHAFEAAP